MSELILERRATSILLKALPPTLDGFDAAIYVIVGRKSESVVPGEYGRDVRLDPCTFKWETKRINIRIPLDINPGITGVEDLDPDFFDAVQAAFLTLAWACV